MIRTAVTKNVEFSLIGVMLLMLPTAGAAASVEIKIATLAPEGSSWMKTFEAIQAEVSQKTNGEIGFKFYPGWQRGKNGVRCRA